MGKNELCTAAGQCGCKSNQDCTLPNTCMGMVCSCAPKNCMQLNKTCGGPFSDGCFMMIPCDDMLKDGNETDVDCGGDPSTCATRCGPGKKCNVDGDCQTGLTCQDGVCCNTPCAGACQACTAALKGQGADGICGPVKAGGGDPHGECTSDPQSSCGDEIALCDGSGACAKWPAGTVCKAASCGGNTLTKAETCAAGACTAPNPPTQECTPYLCKGSACGTSCTSDAGCVGGYFCSSSQCLAKLASGTACATSNECVSNSCVTGVCCNSACNGKCQGCTAMLTGGSDGTCGMVLPHQMDPSGQCAAQPQSTCKNDGKCTAGGNCEQWPFGTTGCSNDVSCVATTLTTDTQCDGTGNCSVGAMMSGCGNYSCGSNTCNTSCPSNDNQGDTSCAPNFWCNGSACVAEQASGSCTRNNQCKGSCAGGTCQ
jgi:hypothetical protein